MSYKDKHSSEQKTSEGKAIFSKNFITHGLTVRR